MALHLLDCMSCPFCFQKTLVTISPVAWQIVATLQVFPGPLSHLIVHLRAPLSCLEQQPQLFRVGNSDWSDQFLTY